MATDINNEIGKIEALTLPYSDNGNKNFILRDYQKDFIKSINTHNYIYFRKARQCGLSTLYAAHVASQIDEDIKANCHNLYTVITLSQNGVNSIRDKVVYFLKELGYSLNNSELKCRLNCSSCHKIKPGTSSKEIGFDECEYFDNFPESLTKVNPDAKIVCFSSPKEGFKLTPNDNVHYQEIHWYQIPRYNKNLKWINATTQEEVKEPIIDEDGNIKYNESHFKEMFNKGFKPTSEDYQHFIEIGMNEEELF